MFLHFIKLFVVENSLLDKNCRLTTKLGFIVYSCCLSTRQQFWSGKQYLNSGLIWIWNKNCVGVHVIRFHLLFMDLVDWLATKWPYYHQCGILDGTCFWQVFKLWLNSGWLIGTHFLSCACLESTKLYPYENYLPWVVSWFWIWKPSINLIYVVLSWFWVWMLWEVENTCFVYVMFFNLHIFLSSVHLLLCMSNKTLWKSKHWQKKVHKFGETEKKEKEVCNFTSVAVIFLFLFKVYLMLSVWHFNPNM